MLRKVRYMLDKYCPALTLINLKIGAATRCKLVKFVEKWGNLLFLGFADATSDLLQEFVASELELFQSETFESVLNTLQLVETDINCFQSKTGEVFRRN